MKTNYSILQNNNVESFAPLRAKNKAKQESYKTASSVAQNSIENNRPAKSVNFSGSASLNNIADDIIELGGKKVDLYKVTSEAIRELQEAGVESVKNLSAAPKGSWAEKFLDSGKVKKVLQTVYDNEALFENIITIFLAGLLKPICVLLMPGTEEKDKQANATKNFVAAVTGFVLSTAILTPISKGVKKVTKDYGKYIKGIDSSDYIKLIDPKYEGQKVIYRGKEYVGGSLSDAYTTFYKKVADLGITPTKAAITIGFMPYVLNFLFKEKNEKKAAAKQAAELDKIKAYEGRIQLDNNEEIFKKFSRGELK